MLALVITKRHMTSTSLAISHSVPIASQRLQCSAVPTQSRYRKDRSWLSQGWAEFHRVVDAISRRLSLRPTATVTQRISKDTSPLAGWEEMIRLVSPLPLAYCYIRLPIEMRGSSKISVLDSVNYSTPGSNPRRDTKFVMWISGAILSGL